MRFAQYRHHYMLFLLLIAAMLNTIGTKPAFAAAVIYVDVTAAGANNGTSWNDAYLNLQTALASAQSGDQIWVASGIYKPTSSSDRSIAFELKPGVAIYGGFSGGESQLNQRDWFHNIATLSGDIGTLNDASDNSYHVVSSSGLDSTSILDGFTITAGNASGNTCPGDGCGAGMLNDNSSPTLENLVIKVNNANMNGAGIYNHASSPTCMNLDLETNTTIGGGGGIANDAGSSPNILDSSMRGNSATYGGGIINFVSSTPTLTNLIISGNTAANGAGIYNTSSSPTMTNLTISGNQATGNGGGIFNSSSSPAIRNTILWDNKANIGPQINNQSSNPTLSYSLIQHGLPTGTSDAGHNISSDPLFLSPVSSAPSTSGILRLRRHSPATNTGNSQVSNPSLPLVDRNLNPRIVSGFVDIGAYEDQNPGFWYVNAVATGANNGQSWADAYLNLQSALAVAQNDDQIWVASGTYTPTSSSDRMIAFGLKAGVAVYGGFSGNENLLSQRNWQTYITTLSGDIGAPNVSSDNSYHVVSSSGLDSTTILDGFTITAGNASGNTCPGDGCGAAILNDASSPLLTHLLITANTATNGAGIYNHTSSPTLTNLIIQNNITTGGGGGIASDTGSSPLISNSIIRGNSATYGGGIINFVNSTPTLTNLVVSGNTAANGAGIYNTSSSPTITNLTISGNQATGNGGGIFNSSSSPAIRNTILWDNRANIDPEMNNQTSNPTLSYSLIQHGLPAGTIDAGHNMSSDPLFLTPVGTAPTINGDLQLQARSPAINSGNNSLSSPSLPNTDLQNQPRIIGGTTDLGAYEANPAVVSIKRASPNPTNATSVAYRVDFNMPVFQVSISDFLLTTGISGAHISQISGSGSTRIITITTASASGILRLDLQDTDTITATPGIQLGGIGSGNGDYTDGEVYLIDKVNPMVQINSGPAPVTNQNSASFSFSGTDGQGSGIANFECSLDNAAYSVCNNPTTYTNLSVGLHTFKVRAIDKAGNIDPNPATSTWSINITPINYNIYLPVIRR